MNINLLKDDELAHLRSLIASTEKVAIVCHKNADGDALGSSLGWAEYLRQQGKEAQLIVPDMYPDYLQWLPGLQQSIRYDKKTDKAKEVLKEADMICYMDLNTISRTGDEMQKELEGFEGKTVLIDHHESPEIKGDVMISFPKMSSTSEMVFRLIWQLGGFDEMTKNMAIDIYCGMMTDTGGFTYNSSKPEIFFIISQLLTKEIDKDKIYRNIYHVYTLNRMRLCSYVIYQKLKLLTPQRAAYFTISKEDMKRFDFKKGDAEGLVNKPLQIKDIRLSISLREDTEKANLIWVSLRSVDNFPCDEMAARFFNGGGHKNAAGGKLECTLTKAEETVKTAVREYKNYL
ncbi:MAG: DHH family phosphoesterase [Prevotella sp.]|nr:DHH family phosphoesterase [Prevotella sp.]